jgi:hypothetical protein
MDRRIQLGADGARVQGDSQRVERRRRYDQVEASGSSFVGGLLPEGRLLDASWVVGRRRRFFAALLRISISNPPTTNLPRPPTSPSIPPPPVAVHRHHVESCPRRLSVAVPVAAVLVPRGRGRL